MSAASVESLLGVPDVVRGSRLGLSDSIVAGLPVSALDALARLVAPEDPGFKYRLVPKATLERRRRSESRRLTSDEGEKLARLAKVVGFALDVYRDPAKVRLFLERPHAMIDGRAPLDVALATGPGADAVINLLGGVAYGGGV